MDYFFKYANRNTPVDIYHIPLHTWLYIKVSTIKIIIQYDLIHDCCKGLRSIMLWTHKRHPYLTFALVPGNCCFYCIPWSVSDLRTQRICSHYAPVTAVYTTPSPVLYIPVFMSQWPWVWCPLHQLCCHYHVRHLLLNALQAAPRLNIKTIFPRYWDSHVKDKTVARPSYLKPGDPFTGKTTWLYWDDPLWFFMVHYEILPRVIWEQILLNKYFNSLNVKSTKVGFSPLLAFLNLIKIRRYVLMVLWDW